MPLIHFLHRQSNKRIWITCLILSIALSELVTGLMGKLLQGKVTFDYLLTGFVASFLVAGLVVALLIFFLTQLRQDAIRFHDMSQNLIKSEERTRLAITASQSALWDLDLTTWNIFLSDGWLPFLCRGENTTVTTLKILNQLVPEEERPMLDKAIIAAMKGQNDSTYKITHRVKKLDGIFIWVRSEGRVTERDKNGRALRMSGINRDITELKIAEDQINAQIKQILQTNTELQISNTKLEQAQSQLLQSEKLAAIGLLAAGVAHEINNPIAYINSNLGTLTKYLNDIFSMMNKYESAEKWITEHPLELEELQSFRKSINLDYLQKDTRDIIAESREGLEHVKRIVVDLKDFSHTGSEETWKSSDIQQILESSLTMVMNEIKYKCEVRKEFTILPKIFCLPSRLNQVFINLLLNAAQSIKEHGVVTLRTGQESNQVRIEIADTGEGIEPKNMNRIFDPFFTTKPLGQGTGLGLSLSYSIVEKHFGRIEVHSEVNIGTVFRVWLPVKQPNSNAML